ncbi:elongator complex protein 5 isoform X2 [Hevea brasiliensis]|uniref:elongator complex protein 5 isoform X2 n=1 Tax=Hevea brasiliensis TaxID=3981 RepID=UPI0025D5F105|nr:elongator complex protein 5 isoform X2 [Hevea brasiliensis]
MQNLKDFTANFPNVLQSPKLGFLLQTQRSPSSQNSPSIMAESICRTLRDGSLEGEHAPALTIKDTAASPFGFDVFAYVLSQLSSFILAGKSQSRVVVVVAFTRSPSFYVDLLKRRGLDVTSFHKWIQILDCYTDPLGWKGKLVESGNAMCISDEASSVTHLCKDVRDLDNLYSLILELGKGLAGQGKAHFSVAIDSVNEMLRHASLSRVAGLLSNLRSHDQISCIYWLLHSDLHEVRVTSSVEYMSSMVANVEPLNPSASGQRWDSENVSLLKQNFQKGKLNVRFKRRNGRVRLMCEEFHIEQSGINFTPVSSEDGTINQGLLPKVQFSLQLSEKEQTERAKEMANPYKFMMVEDLSRITKMRQHLRQLGICKEMRPLVRVR